LAFWLEPARASVIIGVAHGRWYERAGAQELRRGFRWALDRAA
jgi:hypothetical protein